METVADMSLSLLFPVDRINGSSEFESGDLVSTVTRVMVSQNRLYSDTEEVLALQVFSEVIEMEGKEVTKITPQIMVDKVVFQYDFTLWFSSSRSNSLTCVR